MQPDTRLKFISQVRMFKFLDLTEDLGRVVLNVWRLMRSEATLTQYTFEHCVYHVLHKRVPWFSYHTLKHWYSAKSRLNRWRVVKHYMGHVTGCFDLLEELNFVERTSEFARLFGILFDEVITRGSQFRVESIMLRLAKSSEYVAFSPSRSVKSVAI